jgi:hypothetical protein
VCGTARRGRAEGRAGQRPGARERSGAVPESGAPCAAQEIAAARDAMEVSRL